MLYFESQDEYRRYLYRKDLTRTANGLGALMLVIFTLEIICVYSLSQLLKSAGVTGVSDYISEVNLLENALISSLMFFLTALIYVLLKRRSFGALFPFEKIGAKKLAMLAIIGIAVSLLCNIAPNLLSEVFGLFGLKNRGGDFTSATQPPSPLMYFLTVAIIPAFMEEFMFRGVIMGSLRKYSDSLALVVSSGLFSLTHGNYVQIPFTFCCGLVFGFLVLKTNSLLPSIIVHFLNNGTSVVFDLMYQYNVMPAALINLLYGLLIMTLSILALIFVSRTVKKDENFFRLPRADDGIPYRTKLKTVAGSPTMISFTIVMILYSTYVLMQPYLIEWGVIKH